MPDLRNRAGHRLSARSVQPNEISAHVFNSNSSLPNGQYVRTWEPYSGQSRGFGVSGVQAFTETSSRCFGKKYRIQVSREWAAHGMYPHSFLPWLSICSDEIRNFTHIFLAIEHENDIQEWEVFPVLREGYLLQAAGESSISLLPLSSWHSAQSSWLSELSQRQQPFHFAKQSTVVGFNLMFVLLWCFPPIFLLCHYWRLLFCRAAGCLNILALVVACVCSDWWCSLGRVTVVCLTINRYVSKQDKWGPADLL